MSVLSWNLFGLSDDHLDVRTEAALFEALLGGPPERALKGGTDWRPPDVLLFQEVVERSYMAHLRTHLRAAGYRLFPERPSDQREYFETIAIGPTLEEPKVAIHPLPSRQGRELVALTARREDVEWLFLTGHLESMKAGAEWRMQQCGIIYQRLQAHQGPAVFGGDTNLRESEMDVLPSIPDAWSQSGSNPKERMTRISPRTGYGARYDQLWGAGVSFSHFRCLGRSAVTPDGQPASDHLGIIADVHPNPLK